MLSKPVSDSAFARWDNTMGALKANDGGEYPAASDRTNIVMNSSLRDRFQETLFQLVQVAVELWFMYYPHLNSGAVMLSVKLVYEVQLEQCLYIFLQPN